MSFAAHRGRGAAGGDRVGVDGDSVSAVAIAALSRLGVIKSDAGQITDLSASVRPGRTEILTDLPIMLRASSPGQVLVLGGRNRVIWICRPTHLNRAKSSTWKNRSDAVELPAWYRPNPDRRDLAFIAFSLADGDLVAKQITNYRWASRPSGPFSTAARPQTDIGVLFDARCTMSPHCLPAWAARSWAEPAMHCTCGLRPDRQAEALVCHRRLHMGHAVTWSTIRRSCCTANWVCRSSARACRPIVGAGRRSVRTGARRRVFATTTDVWCCQDRQQGPSATWRRTSNLGLRRRT